MAQRCQGRWGAINKYCNASQSILLLRAILNVLYLSPLVQKWAPHCTDNAEQVTSKILSQCLTTTSDGFALLIRIHWYRFHGNYRRFGSYRPQISSGHHFQDAQLRKNWLAGNNLLIHLYQNMFTEGESADNWDDNWRRDFLCGRKLTWAQTLMQRAIIRGSTGFTS